MHWKTSHSSVFFVAWIWFLPAAALAADGERFRDLQPGDFATNAALYLREKGIMQGYDDGTFRPDKSVNRAEAIKIIVSPLLKENEASGKMEPVYTDVPADAWYVAAVEWARKKGVVSGPPKSTAFSPGRTVTKAEFLKMFLTAYGIDPATFGDMQSSLAIDVPNPKEWYYPYLRYAVSSSMTQATKADLLAPGRPLTRGDAAVLLHRYFLYREGERTQELLTLARSDVERSLDALAHGRVKEAEQAAARAFLMARGAHAKEPEEAATKIAVKTAESVRSLVRAYAAGLENDLEAVVKHSKDAWSLADQARSISTDAAPIAKQLQGYASSFAESARKQKR